jgi:hypothetical protein
MPAVKNVGPMISVQICMRNASRLVGHCEDLQSFSTKLPRIKLIKPCCLGVRLRKLDRILQKPKKVLQRFRFWQPRSKIVLNE